MNYQLIIDSFIGPYGYSKTFIRRELSQYAGKHVDVKISSPGGSLDDGLDIRQQFLDHGDVTVYLSGFVASAATVIAMGAKKIVMSKYAMFLVHKCSNFIDAWGSYNADQLQKLIEDLSANKKENDKIDVVLASMYADKCKKKISEILDILKEGRWMTAQEAFDYGFVDELADMNDTEQKRNFSWEVASRFNALGLPVPVLEGGNNEHEGVGNGLLARLTDASARAIQALKRIHSDSNDKISNNENMKTYNFETVKSKLNIDSIEPDNNGLVSIKAEQLEKLNDIIEQLEKDNSANAAKLTAAQKDLSEVKEQLENLKKAPGDVTSEVEDPEDKENYSAKELFNSINSII